MRDITSEPPNRCGFSNDVSAISSPVPRSRRRNTTVVVPRSTATPRIGPVDRSTSTPSIRILSPSRVTAGSSWGARLASGKPNAWRSMRMWPRRMVWQRTWPSSAITHVWHERRKLPFRWCSGAVGAERAPMPSTTSTMHSLHLPCLRQEVGTSMPRSSACSNSDFPDSAVMDCPLMLRVTAITGEFLPGLCFQIRFQRLRDLARRAIAFRFLAPLPLGEVVVHALQSLPGGEQIDVLHESFIEHHADVFRLILRFDL